MWGHAPTSVTWYHVQRMSVTEVVTHSNGYRYRPRDARVGTGSFASSEGAPRPAAGPDVGAGGYSEIPVRRSHLKYLYGADLADHSSNPTSVFAKQRRLPNAKGIYVGTGTFAFESALRSLTAGRSTRFS